MQLLATNLSAPRLGVFGAQAPRQTAASNRQFSNSGKQFALLQKNNEEDTIQLSSDSNDRIWMQYQQQAEQAIHTGDWLAAENHWLQALKVTANFGETDARLVITLNRICRFYYQMQRFDQCEIYCKRALLVVEKKVGTKNHPDVASCLTALAAVYYNKNQFSLAEPLCLEAFAIYQQLPRANNADIGTALHNLAMVYHGYGKYKMAERFYLLAISHQIEVLGARHSNIETLLNNYKDLRASMNRLTHRFSNEYIAKLN